MNIDTIRKCAEIAAQHQQNVIGHVQADVQELLDALNAEPAEEEAAATEPVQASTAAKKAKKKTPAAE